MSLLKPYTIGKHVFANNLALAPMAGVTDKPTRQLARQYGAGLVVAEMISADPSLLNTRKSQLRREHEGEPGPRIVQIVGYSAQMLAEAAKFNADQGADIIDINMGCPAKKVFNKAAGSALLADPSLVADILEAVVKAVDIPVSLKFRTGVTPDDRNALTIAGIAEDKGIQSLALHGRTRVDMYKGQAEYDTIKAVVAAVGLPVFANGDITTAQQAKEVLEYTGAAGLMLGRGVQGKPWLFGQITAYLKSGDINLAPTPEQMGLCCVQHIDAIHRFYGEPMGIRIARKHIAWYLANMPNSSDTRRQINHMHDNQAQLDAIRAFFDQAHIQAEKQI